MTTISSTGVAATSTATPATSPERARLHQAAQAFEAIFVRQMLSTARQSSFGDTLWGDDKGQDTFTAMRDERFADITAKSGALGLAKQVERDLSARLGDAAPVPAAGGQP